MVIKTIRPQWLGHIEIKGGRKNKEENRPKDNNV